MYLSALLPHWEPRAKVMRMLTAGACGVFKVLSKKQLQNLKTGSLEEGCDACFIDTYALGERIGYPRRSTGTVLCSLALSHFGGDNNLVTV